MPQFDWIQVEISSRCNATCIYCPHTIYGRTWKNRNMPMKTFEKLMPLFPKTELVFLQGWGEPFMNPLFFEMLTQAKSAGVKVGTSTNGMLLTENIISRLVESEIDIMAFSLAGIGSNNNYIRQETDFDAILGNIGKIKETKKALQKEQPDIHIAYLLLKSKLDDLERLPESIEEYSVNQIVVSTLDFVPNKELEKEVIRPKDMVEYNELKHYLDEVAARLNQCGIKSYYHLCHPTERQRICTENIWHSFFVSANGDISPCVFAGLPVSKAECYIKSSKKTYQPMIFGNLNEKSMGRIWFQKVYEAFRESFEKEKPDYICPDCPKLYMT